MLSFQSTLNDSCLDPMIRQILPEVEQSLREEMMRELEEQFKRDIEAEFANIEEKARMEYEQAHAQLEEEGKKLLSAQSDQIRKEIQKLRRQKQSKEESHFRELQDRYISENFHEFIMNHPKIKELENELIDEIWSNNEGKVELQKSRKIKELTVKMESKEQKDIKQKDKLIKQKVYTSGGIEELKKDIEILKIGIASMKSEYNIKIKKVETEIKQLKIKNKSLQTTEDIGKLRARLEELRDERDKLNNKILAEPAVEESSFSRNTSHLDSSSDYSMLRQNNNEIKFIHEDVVMESDEESENSSEPSQSFENQQIMHPPTYQISIEESGAQIESYCSSNRILGFDIASLLRSEWEVDPLQKYLKSDEIRPASKENDAQVINRSNFQQKYRQHLQKLNKGSQRKHLSNHAKKAIIHNLSMMNRNRF